MTIVTPSYNMASFIEQTIESVLCQDYPRIEYLVIDGGSTDGTLDILRDYKDRLAWVSQRDNGPADALNRGFRIGRGSIFAWLNADDTYLPGAVSSAVNHLLAHPEAGAVYGDGHWTDAAGRVIARYPTREFDQRLLRHECFICQPACFLRSETFDGAGMLDPALHYAFDYDLWIRASSQFRFEYLPLPLATSRMHPANKTIGERRKIFEENFRILKKHYGYVPFRWIHSYCSFVLDGRDQFFEPLRPTFGKYLFSLPMGCWYNRNRLHKYCSEWVHVMSRSAFCRLLRQRWEAALNRVRFRPLA